MNDFNKKAPSGLTTKDALAIYDYLPSITSKMDFMRNL